MMTPKQLFFARLKNNGKEQLRAWNSVFDWTVWTYLLIPGIIIFGGLYRELWQQMPDWAMSLPWAYIYPIVLFVLMLVGRIRVFVEDADRLFLLQRPEWFKALKRLGMMYSFVRQAAVMLLPFVLLLPFLLKVENMEMSQIGAAYLYSYVIGMILSMTAHLLGGLKGWRSWLLGGLCVLVVAAAYLIPMLLLASSGAESFAAFIAALAGIIIVFFIILVLCLRTGISFEDEVKHERDARMRSTELLMSQVIESKPRIRTKRPFLFRQSQRLFRKSDAGTMLAEMRIKSFVRAMTPIRIWIGFISISSYAITLVPPSAGFAVMVVLTMLGASWLHMQWEQWYAEEFIAQFPWTKQDAKRAIVVSRFWLVLPAVIWWSVIAILRLTVL